MWERFESGHHLTDIWRFIGNVGVTLMIMESGMHIHFDKVALVGKKAFGVAVVGTGLPIVIGFLVVGERLSTLLCLPFSSIMGLPTLLDLDPPFCQARFS